MPIENDVNIDKLITEVSSLFSNKEEFNQPQSTFDFDSLNKENTTITTAQSPVKGTVRCYGIFGSGDARHNGIHNGVDLGAPGGTSVYPMLPGIVSNVSYTSKGGNNIVITHDNNISTYYAHLGTVTINKGDKVNQNTVLGTIGNSGNASGTMPHLHFEVSQNKQKQNPNKYFTVPAYKLPPKGEPAWLSDEYKNQARAFKMNDHLKARRVAFTKNIDRILKLSFIYHKLTKI